MSAAPEVPGVEAIGVSRRFKAVPAVRNVDLVAPRGAVTGLVGPNGAGKTTLLLMLATLLVPDSGKIRVAGHDPVTETDLVRARMGWSPDVFGMYDNLTVREYLSYAAAAYRMDGSRVPQRVDQLLQLAKLTEKADRPVHELSRGQKQRLGLVRALIHEPDVLLLDEPASGLDPTSRIELRHLLRSLAGDGLAIIVSSHLLDDLDEMADSIVFMNNGETVGQRTVGELQQKSHRSRWRIRALDPQALASSLSSTNVEHQVLPNGSAELLIDDDAAAAELLRSLVTGGVPVTSFAPSSGAVEAEYLRLTEGDR
jgi:ABC-2 type transport system ATP-binding protein